MGHGKYLGIDIGTTSLKAAVFDKYGKRLALRSVDYTLDTGSKEEFIEFDAEKYIDMCKSVIDELSEECGGLDAISVDTQGETLILTDKEGKAVCPAVVWLDNRAEAEAELIKAKFGTKRVYEVTGQPEITATWPASKILWFKRNRPELFSRCEKIFMLEDWILYRLTGNFVTEPTIQSSTIYYDITNGEWWDEMLDFIGISSSQLPELCDTSCKIGEYRGIPVVSGMLDQIAGTLGAGASSERVISEMTGTIMAICSLTDKIPEFCDDSIIPCHVHAIKGRYCRILWSSTAGMALKWFKNQLAEEFSFGELDKLASEVPAGSLGLTVLPHFCGSTMPKYNPNAKAVFSGVTLAHTRAHFARAIMESVAFMLRADLEYIGTDGIDEIRITGGGAKSPLWAGIKADVTGKVLKTVSEAETACLGAALSAMVGVGVYSDIREASQNAVVCESEYAPSGVNYDEAYARYVSLEDMMI